MKEATADKKVLLYLTVLDINAAKNILKKGVTSLGIVGREPSEITNACGEPRSSVKQESPNSLQVTA